MSTAGTDDGKARWRDRWRLTKSKHFRSSSPATPASQSGTTKPKVQSSSKPANQVPSSVPQPSNAPSSSLIVQPVASSSSTSHDFLAAARQHLSPRELQILQPCILSANDDINNVLKQSVAKVKEKQAECEAKRWTFTIAGRSIVLREEADKVIHWLNRFKSVGDIAASADPVHAGLAWAGVRLLLEVLVSEANVMASLLVGCKTVLYMINRLDAYLAFWHSLPDPLSPKLRLKDLMAEMYACVLGFLAQAIETYQKSGLKRALSSLWQESDVRDFESRCKDHADGVEKQAAACDRALREKDSKAIVQSYQDLQRILQELQQIRSVQAVVDRIERKIDLQGLKIVPEALFDARTQKKRAACHPSTREALLQQIRDWARGADSKSIFWLQGMAGTGKSTISRTIANWLCSHAPKNEVQLGATFFFERGENDRASADFLFPTIIHQLAQKIPGLDVLVAEAVGHNSEISSKSSAEQFKVLIRQPSQQLTPTSDQPVCIIVVDALDECKTDEIIQVQQLLSELPTLTNVRLRLFLTSRPNIPIQQSLSLPSDARWIVVLDEVPEHIVRQDILAYLRAAFVAIRTDYNSLPLVDEPLPASWPDEKVVHDLANMAFPLFIVAATIHRFVYDFGSNQPDPQECLAVILRSRKLGHLSPLRQIYLPVLGYLTPLPEDMKDSVDYEELCREFRMIIGCVITLAEPLSRKALAQLLNLPSKTIARHMRPLYSVLQIPSVADDPIRILHLSFAEFLTSSKISDRPFAINNKATHDMLFNKCIELLSSSDSRGLRENICHLKFSGQSRHDLRPAQVDEQIPLETQYACRYWVYHAQKSQHEIRDNGIIHTFFRKKFLHWLEALSLMGCLAVAIKDIGKLQLLVTGRGSTCDKPTDVKSNDSNLYHQGSTNIKDLLEDARRFILANRYVCEQAPLQLYSSSLIFAPGKSIIREECNKMPSWIERVPRSHYPNWGPEIQMLEGHADWVNAVTFSPNGALVASASNDCSVRLWDVSTGQEVQKLEGHTDWVVDVVFASPDGSILASSSQDSTVRLWDLRTGNEVQKLEGLGKLEVNPIVCSPDKALLACLHGHMILLCKTADGQETRKLEGGDEVTALAFSFDGAVLASASDTVVQLWSMSTWQCARKLEASDLICSIAFSSNNVLASGSDGGMIQLWDTATGQELGKLEGHSEPVRSVAFSPLDGGRLVSASDDLTARIWDVDSSQEIQRLRGHTLFVTAASFSPDGKMIASASVDRTVRLWSTSSDEETQQLSDGGSPIKRVVFSPETKLLASVDEENIVRLFDVATGDELQVLKGHTGFVTSIAFSNDGALVATASYDSTVRLWHTETGRLVRKFEDYGEVIGSVRFLQYSTSLASASWDGTVRIWSITTGEEIRRFEGDDSGPTKMTFSSDEVLLALSMRDDIWLWSLGTEQEVRKLKVKGRICALAISFDKTLIAWGTTDGTVYLRELSTGQTTQTKGHASWINALAFDPDDALLASACEHTIRLWNVSTGQEVQKLQGNMYIKELKFAPNKSILITDLGSIRIGLAENGGTEISSYPGVNDDIFVNDDWIQHRGKNLLWLPKDYRQGFQTAVHGNIAVIGRTDGRICILKINCS